MMLFIEVAKKLVSRIKSMALAAAKSGLNTTQPRAQWTLSRMEIRMQARKQAKERLLFERMTQKKLPIKINPKRVLIIKENKNSF